MDAWWSALSVCAWVLAIAAWRPIWAWRLRKLPGPRRLPLLGNLPGIIAKGLTVWREEQARIYGSVFQMWNGSVPVVVVADADLGRKLLITCTARPQELNLFTCLTGEPQYVASHGILTLNPETHRAKFRSLRKAFELAVLTPAALAAHAGMLCQNASRLVTYLSRYAASNEPLDMTVPLSDMTMDAIGFAAFGLDLNCLGADDKAPAGPADSKTKGRWTEAPIGSPEFSQGLVDACRLLFKYTDMAQSSPWKLPCVFLPALHGVTRRVANLFPDKLLKHEVQVRQELNDGIRAMVWEWKRHKESSAAGASNVSLPAISEQGFLAKLLDMPESEESVGELDIVAHALTMVLAGFETTASTLATALHLLAQDPQAQARFQIELDEVLHGKLATTEDLERLPYLCAVFDEALRLYPPGDVATVRLLTPSNKDLDLGDGRFIPGGAFVWVDMNAMQRDPAIWPRATEFLPERFIQPGNEALAPSNPNALIPFGLGARMCPGYKFALMEGRITLARLLQAYTFKPAPGCPLPKWKTGIVYTPEHVWLTISPRTGSVKAQTNGK